MQVTTASPFRKSLLLATGLALGSALCALPATAATAPNAAAAKASPAAGKAASAQPGKKAPANRKLAKKNPAGAKPGPLADLHGKSASPDVVMVANWASYTHNNQNRPFIIIDKKNAHVWVFDGNAKLKEDAPALLGVAVGDDSAPGVGSKRLSQISDDQKTTPAGRFLAARGQNNHGDEVIWIDYNNAVSMHRVRSVSASERRVERLATPEADDNRISNGCVNVPPAFFNKVQPVVAKYGAVIYVLPETRSAQQQFGAYDVTKRNQLAQSAPSQS